MLPRPRSAVQSAARVVDQRKAQVADAQSRLAQYQQTATQQVAIRQASVRSQEANAQSAQARLEQAQLQLSYTKIVAPVDGIVMKRSAEVGAHVSAGQQLAHHRSNRRHLGDRQFQRDAARRASLPNQTGAHPCRRADAEISTVTLRTSAGAPAPSAACCRLKTPPAIT